MAAQWTKEQRKVIDIRNRNILVSAAAGSGKTTVLVERILSRISDTENPIDIDRMVIVTFTNAAAAEMKEKIREALEQKLEDFPESEHLQKQMLFIHHAQITTIDSFCLHVIRNHFQEIDLDPGFRIGEEGELALIKEDVINHLLEEYYSEGREEFSEFIECYSSGKTDQKIVDMILVLHRFARSYPWPQKWLKQCGEAYCLEDLEAMQNTEWLQILLENVGNQFQDIKKQAEKARNICMESDGPYMYEAALNDDLAQWNELCESKDFQALSDKLSCLKFSRLSSKKDETIDSDKRDFVKAIRDRTKKQAASIQKQYFFQSPEQQLMDMKRSRSAVEMLIELTLRFENDYQKKKQEMNLVDFNDLEHFALNILVQEIDGVCMPTNTAREMSEQYVEIMIDEYQDSNLVQELILQSISKEQTGEHNIFMVGDVKQSIYKFRLARPELFMDKYETYTLEDGDCQRIDLHKNFRSREQVLNCVNYIFKQIMGRKLGRIEYDAAEALFAGAKFPELPAQFLEKVDTYTTEILFIDLEEEAEEKQDGSNEEEELPAKELEAKAIAGRIRELTDKEKGIPVYDKLKQCYRTAEYKDIVILLRTVSGWADNFVTILEEEGIPAYAESRTGYFTSPEIQILLSLLHVIDNPRQDIPLAAVLVSPIGGISERELASIKSGSGEETLYNAIEFYHKSGIAENTREKVQRFFKLLESFRNRVRHMPIHKFLWMVLEKTGFGNYISAMAGGEQRKINVDMLVEKALAFEQTSYKGLFHFIRYIEHLQKFNIEIETRGISGEQDNIVRLMSIHKSKGLEFPIVFVSGLGKRINQQDARSRIVLHPDFGIGADYIDWKSRIRKPTILKRMMQRQMVLENLGEELRVFYVALTRAKEKLIMTGSVAKMNKKMEKYRSLLSDEREQIPYTWLSESLSYMDWVFMALQKNSPFWKFMKMENLFGEANESHTSSPFIFRSYGKSNFIIGEMHEQIKKERGVEKLYHMDFETIYDADVQEQLAGQLGYQYPFENETGIYTKMTVTELKKSGQLMEDESAYLFAEKKQLPQIPEFMKTEIELSGTDRGTAYHKIMQYLQLEYIDSKEMIISQIKELTSKGKLSKETSDCINIQDIVKFAHTRLAKRMKEASMCGKLKREKQFVIGMDADVVNPEFKSKETILVQGIIDVFFEEDDELILIDYKTDSVKKGNEKRLIDRYKVQLESYAGALEQITGKKVREQWLYSFSLGEAIMIGTSY